MRDILFRMQKAELEQLRDAIVSQQIKHPYKSISISPILNNVEMSQAIADSLNKVGTNFGPDKVGIFVDMLYQDSCKRNTDKNYELVWTGPEGDNAYNRDTRVVVQQLFDQAKSSVLIAGFAFYNAKDLFKDLASKHDTNEQFKITMCLNVHREYRDVRANQEVLDQFKQSFRRYTWPNKRIPHVFYDPRSLETETKKKAQLHAKCIVIDDSIAFIGSANFTDKAQLNNIETGVLIRDQEFAFDLSRHFLGLVEANHLLTLGL